MCGLALSRVLAIAFGLGLPALEIARRWRTLPGPPDTWQYWLDDVFIGALLLGAAWLSRAGGSNPVARSSAQRAAWLTAAWGIYCGALGMSLLAQIDHLLHPELGEDPSGIAHGWVVLVKALLVAVGAAGLAASMRGAREGGRP